MPTISGAIADELGPGDNILLLCPSFTADEGGACTDLLTVADPPEENVLSIAFMDSPGDRVDCWRRYVETSPGGAAIVDVDTNTRSTAAQSSPADVPATSYDLSVDSVGSPGDLTTLGVRITNRLDEWRTTAPDRQIVVCFRSITTLLQYVDRQLVFKFLHVLTERFTSADAIAHYHMDPTAHDEQTLNMLSQVFDAVCEDDAGEWTFRSR